MAMADIKALSSGAVEKKEEEEKVKLRVVGQDGSEIHFVVQPWTVLVKLKKLYADRVGVPLSTLRFCFDGERVDDDATVRSLKLEPDDIIEVFQRQVGG